MAIISIVEQSRQAGQLLGGVPELTRTFSVTLSAAVPAPAIAQACGVSLGSPHPDFPAAVVVDVQVEESRIEDAPLETVEAQNEQNKKEAQDNTPLPLPPDEILETELPVLISEEDD